MADWHPSLPIETRADAFAAEIDAAADAPVTDLESFTDAVAALVPDVQSVRENRDVLSLGYVTDVTRHEGVGHHVAGIAGAYAALVAADYDAYALGTTIYETEDQPVGSAVVYTAWASGYNAGRYTTAEYGELVSSTIESTRYPPTIDVDPDE